jgi:ABC-2 type transport system permease protein
MTLARATLSQARAHFDAIRQRVRGNLREQRLMSGTISAFLAAYMVAAFVLVSRGLEYVQRLPLLGPLLTERTLHLIFFFFFLMLILSNATITGMSLFRRRETGWLLSLPLPPAGIVLWKTFEGLLLSSWGLIVLSAPILAAFGRVLGAGASFYLLSFTAIILLISIAGNLSTWLLLSLVRFYRPWWLRAASLLLGAGLFLLIVSLGTVRRDPSLTADVSANFRQILHHTQFATHPLLPSTWVANVALASAKGLGGSAAFYTMTLLSHALAVWIVSIVLAQRWFFQAWNRTLHQAELQRQQSGRLPASTRAAALFSRVADKLHVPRPVRAMAAKDARTFLREPAQWGQCTLIFGLLLIYTSNLRNLGYNYADPFWSTVVSYLNLTVCALSMSTLTTRFVFPQFSMEGQRFWIVGVAPFPLTRVLRQKLWINWLAATPLTTLLIVISSVSLRLPLHRAVFFVASMALMSIGLNALALSLGALIPNFRESNSAKIVSGFGGTLCLILSFFYIIAWIGILTIPAIAEHGSKIKPTPEKVRMLEVGAFCGALLLTLLAGATPYFLAKNRMKKMAYLGNL